jgi:hypothetical protein
MSYVLFSYLQDGSKGEEGEFLNVKKINDDGRFCLSFDFSFRIWLNKSK